MPAILEIFTEEDLHAYVDGRIWGERRRALERYLEEDPEARQKVAAYVRQSGNLIRMFRGSVSGRGSDPRP